AFEHFVNPMEELENMISISKNIIFTTELLPESLPAPDKWWYYGLDHGQHISFYSKRTFEFIARNYGLKYLNVGSLHILTERNINEFKLQLLKLHRFGFHKF
ncbi:MAG: methyltransferase domain-containing protein, partial [Minisyncoccia bacterium]